MALSAHGVRIGLVMVLTAALAVLMVARVAASHQTTPPPQPPRFADTSAGSAAHARNAYRLELASQER
jgi:hypothetical protein